VSALEASYKVGHRLISAAGLLLVKSRLLRLAALACEESLSLLRLYFVLFMHPITAQRLNFSFSRFLSVSLCLRAHKAFFFHPYYLAARNLPVQ
jgi:hypothetical protein